MAPVVVDSECEEDFGEGLVLLLHFLMVATALLCFSGADELCHGGEYAVHAPEAAVHEMAVVDL